MGFLLLLIFPHMLNIMHDADNFQAAIQIIDDIREMFAVSLSLHVEICLLQIICLKCFHLSK